MAPGVKGACGVRVNRDGTLVTLVYDRVISRGVEPIEKKPFFHFHPGSTAYSIATVGCNLRCAFCQNWQISQWPKLRLPRRFEWATDDAQEPLCPQLSAEEGLVAGERVTPDEIVAAARVSGADSIAYTFTEPTVFYELAHDTAVRAREAGLANVWVTNGFICEAPLREIAPLLDAVNVDLKSFRERTYRHVARAGLEPVLNAIRLYRELGVWVEVTTLVIPGMNDSEAELREIAEFVHSVGPEVPWHVSRFFPAWQMADREPTSPIRLWRAREIGLEAGLRYVYEGNVSSRGGGNTRCPRCEQVVIERVGSVMLRNHLVDDGACPRCGEGLDGVGLTSRQPD